ncbi:MAG: SRPBCC family protein [Gammaproteobacteria bacterium]|nr:SRPBCC family protein [Gammaproteobacteria bacterium]
MSDSDAPSRQSDPRAVDVGDSKPVLVARMMDTMNADPETVFATVAHGGRHGEAIPEVESVDFVSDNTMGVGAQFRENRDWNAVQVMFAKFAKLHKNVVECIEYEPHRRVRYMSNGAGARWHSIYTLTPVGEGQTQVELRLEIRPKNLLGRWLPQLMKAPLQESTKNDFEAIKRSIESAQS